MPQMTTTITPKALGDLEEDSHTSTANPARDFAHSRPPLAGDPLGLLRTGSNIGRCTVCGEYFSTDNNFLRHRVGPIDRRRCLTQGELVAIGLHKNAKGLWSRSAPTMKAG